MTSLNSHRDNNYICCNCSKKYKSKTNYDKHRIICNLMSKTSKERRIENEDIDNTPTVRELYSIILNLINKCEMMERKIEKLTNIYNKENKKINVIEWLNSDKSITENETNIDGILTKPIFSEWVETVTITEIDMEYVFKNNFMDGLKHIIKKLLRETEDSNISFPIKAFEQKEGLLYVYDNSNNQKDNNCQNSIVDDNIIEKKWSIMSKEKINLLFSKISKGLIKQLIIWKDKNINKCSDDSFAKIYSNNVKKIIGGNLSIEDQQFKFRKYLYNIIKINIKNITEYEYEF
jgi:hypothetical protein